MLDKEMMGKIMNEVQSYDYLDNIKYKRIEYLLSIMNETFGFDFNVDIEKDGADGNDNQDESKETQGNVEGEIELTKNQTQKRDQTASDFEIFSRNENNRTGALRDKMN